MPCPGGGAVKNAARAARLSRASFSAGRQASAWRRTSTSSFGLEEGAGLLRLGPPSAIALTTERGLLVGIDDLADELAAHNIGPGEGDMVDFLDALQQCDRLEQT